MNCKRVRQAIITDYSDGEVSAAEEKEIKAHLAACAECRKFESSVLRSAVTPFSGARKEEVPPEIWDGILERLPERVPAAAGGLRGFPGRMFVFPRPALLALSSIFVCAAALLVFFRYSPGGKRSSEPDEKMQYVAYLMGYSETISGSRETGYPGIEELFSK